MELDVRKNLDFFNSPILRRFSVILNGSYIKTDVFTPGNGYGNASRSDRKRPLQGQSPWLANAILNYDNIRTGSRLSVSYNYAADRISVVGNNDHRENTFPDIMEKGRGVLDFSLLQRISKRLQLKFSVQDILNNAVLFYEDRNRNYKYDAEEIVSVDNMMRGKGDNIFLRYKPFSYYSLSFNFSFY